MRIYGNRQLKTLPGDNTRPTTSLVREALFNIWQGKILGCRWLDLCAGNGSMGAEALVRGASVVVAIEQNSRACQIIAENWRPLVKEHQQYKIIRGDVRQKLLTLKEQFDYIYFDPPYKSDLYTPVLNTIATLNLLAPNGEIAVEHNQKMWQPLEKIANLSICRQKVYGNSALTFYQLADYAHS